MMDASANDIVAIDSNSDGDKTYSHRPILENPKEENAIVIAPKEDKICNKPGRSHEPGADSKKRMLLREWLHHHLERKTFPGVDWLDREKGTFKIPWMHRAKQCWRLEDGHVFRAWSQHTGTFKMKDSDATHKARFRCVLAKAPDIEYRKDLSNNDTEPYRSYRMKTFEDLRRTNRYTDIDDDVPELLDMDEHTQQPWGIGVTAEEQPAGATQSKMANAKPFAMSNKESPTQQLTEKAMDTKSAPLAEREEHSSIGSIQSDMEVEASYVTTQTNSSRQVLKKSANTKSEPVTRRAGNQYFTVDLYYDGKKVASRPFKEGVTCHICPQNSSNGAEKTTLHMPTWDDKKYGVNDPSKVEAFFQHIGDGIDIELDCGNLYATRRCLVRVFYSSFLKYQLSPHLERGQRTLIFSLKEFGESLQNFSQNEITESMCSPEVYIGFGRPWIFKDGDEKMTFIAVKVKSSEAEEMKNMKLMDDTEHRTNSLTISDSFPENATRMDEESTVPDLR